MITVPAPSEYTSLDDWAGKFTDAVQAFIDETMQVPEIGQIAEFVVLPDQNWLACDGSSFEQATYPVLAQKLGGTVLPNLSPVYDPSYVVGIRVG